MRLIMMRHGNTFEKGQTPLQVGARSDLPLTAFGKAQAEEVLRYLIDAKIVPQAVFAGKLLRQKESAECIARHFGVEVLYAPALTEIDYGRWEGLSSEAIRAVWPNEYDSWTKEAKWPQNIFNSCYESKREALYEWLKTLANTFEEGDCIFAVSSNGLMRFFKNEKVQTGNICELEYSKNGLKINSWNQNVKGCRKK